MTVTTAKGFPSPSGPDDNANHDAIKALADRLDTILSARTAAQITALSGTDLWTGRVERQTDATGSTTRTASGLYVYDGTNWSPVVPDGHPSGFSGSPTLLGSGGNPNMGTSPTQRWEWSLVGGMLIGTFEFVWGTGSPTPGTGNLNFALPRTARPFLNSSIASADPGGRRLIGSGVIKDVSASATRPVYVLTDLAGTNAFFQYTGVAFGTLVTGASPITLGAAGDFIRGDLRYFWQ